jgi:hypothetical protein
MVEAIIALGVLVFMFAAISFMHRMCLASLQAAQEAENQAWTKALRGCVENDVGVQSILTSLMQGDLPLPGGFSVGQSATAQASKTVAGMFGQRPSTLSTSWKIPCNTRPSSASPSSAGEWIFDLF